MKNNFKKLGFSLAEMLIVMLVLTVVLAASMPIITKRATQPVKSQSTQDIYLPKDTTIYVSLSGSDASEDGSSSAPFATLKGAMEYLNKKILLGKVTVQIKDGTYSSSEQIILDHPQSRFIFIQGNTLDRSKVTLNCFGCNGLVSQNGTISNISHLILNGDRSSAYCGLYTNGGQIKADNIVCKNFYYGLYERGGGYVTSDNCQYIQNVKNGAFISESSTSLFNACTISQNNGIGVVVYSFGFAYFNSGNSITNNTGWGLELYNAKVDFNSAGTSNNISGNGSGAINSVNLSVAWVPNVNVSGTVNPAWNAWGNGYSVNGK